MSSSVPRPVRKWLKRIAAGAVAGAFAESWEVGEFYPRVPLESLLPALVEELRVATGKGLEEILPNPVAPVSTYRGEALWVTLKDLPLQAVAWAEELLESGLFLAGKPVSTKYPICPEDAKEFQRLVLKRLKKSIRKQEPVITIDPMGKYHRFTACLMTQEEESAA